MDPTREPPRRSRLEWRSDEEFIVDGVEYVCRPRFDTFDSTAQRFCIRKPREDIERLEALLERTRPKRILELGIHKGGSTALIAQLAEPEKLVALDIDTPQSGDGLRAFVEARGLEGSVKAHWEVDGSDPDRLEQLLAAELADAPLDLVVDDASHLLEPSRASFNALFPRLRPGGTYLLEDWSWAHAPMNLWPQRTPLTVLVFEIVIACAHSPGLIGGLEIDRAWATIERGEGPIDAGRFDVRHLGGETGEELLAALGGPRESATPRWRDRRRRRR